jgi:hypothetical protein
MNKPILIFLCLFGVFHTINAQLTPAASPNDSLQVTGFNPFYNGEGFYLDASVGGFPLRVDAPFFGQIGAGIRINEVDAIGIGGTYFGRFYIFNRFIWGVGVQYRRRFWDKILGKVEMGYIAKVDFDDYKQKVDFAFQPKSSTPAYIKLEGHYRFFKKLSVGLSAAQTATLIFKPVAADPRYATSVVWRVNVFGVHLGLALDGD